MQMNIYFFSANIVSCVSFAFYGMSCFFSQKIKEEFVRYGLSRFRILTGFLQLLGSLGLALGFYFPVLTIISSLGLCLLMLLGIVTRIRIKDSFIQTFPALFYCILNFLIFLYCPV